jgi:hypothetical protein
MSMIVSSVHNPAIFGRMCTELTITAPEGMVG